MGGRMAAERPLWLADPPLLIATSLQGSCNLLTRHASS